MIADGFNRALGTAGAPFLCEDGMYLLDSARPNAYKAAGTWSNLEASGAITASTIFDAQLNFRAYRDDRGQLTPQKMTHLVIRPQDEVDVWELLKSDLRPGDAMNAKNFQYGKFQYIIYDYLTAALCLFVAADGGLTGNRNELIFGDRVAPSIETWVDGDNPDVTRQRIRGRFGMGAGRPYIWRGMTVS